MKAIIPWTGALSAIVLTASLASAGTYYSPVFNVPLPAAPDACGPGFYVLCPNGVVYGPNYCLRPPCMPFAPVFVPPTPAFPSHPYVRGPRDFFMWQENMDDQMRRNQRPALVP